MGKRWNRYPFSSLEKWWSRTFLLGFLVLIAIMTLVDSLFADFEYIRLVDMAIINAYGFFWMILYWLRPDLFEDE